MRLKAIKSVPEQGRCQRDAGVPADDQVLAIGKAQGKSVAADLSLECFGHTSEREMQRLGNAGKEVAKIVIFSPTLKGSTYTTCHSSSCSANHVFRSGGKRT